MDELRRRVRFVDDDLDSVSFATTVSDAPDTQYTLEQILAERTDTEEAKDEVNGETHEVTVKRFLVKWTDYSIYESSWEPEENFEEGKQQVVDEWMTRCMNERRNHVESFDVDKWDIEVEEYNQGRYDKKREKRWRLGLSIEIDSDEEEYDVDAPTIEEGSNDAGSISEGVETAPNNPFTEASSEASDVPLVTKRQNKRRGRSTSNDQTDAGVLESDEEQARPDAKRPKTTDQASAKPKISREKIEGKKRKGKARPVNRKPKELSTDDESDDRVTDQTSLDEMSLDESNSADQEHDASATGKGLPVLAKSAASSSKNIDVGPVLFRGRPPVPEVQRPVPIASMSRPGQDRTLGKPTPEINGIASPSATAAPAKAIGSSATAPQPSGPATKPTATPNTRQADTSSKPESGSSANATRPTTSAEKPHAISTDAAKPAGPTSGGRPHMGPMGHAPKLAAKETTKPPNIFDKSLAKAPRKKRTVAPVLKEAANLSRRNKLMKKSGFRSDQQPPPLGSINSSKRPGRDDAGDSPPLAAAQLVQQTSSNWADANASSSRGPPADETSPDEQEGLLICWYWATPEEQCSQPTRCPFEHRWLESDRVAFDENRLSKEQATCYFWFNGHCRKPDEVCPFSHSLTAYMAPHDPSQGITRLSRDQIDRRPQPNPRARPPVFRPTRAGNPAVPTLSLQAGPEPGEILGCFFYNKHGCNKLARDCPYPHVRTRWFRAPKSGKYEYREDGEVSFRPVHPQQASHEAQNAEVRENSEDMLQPGPVDIAPLTETHETPPTVPIPDIPTPSVSQALQPLVKPMLVSQRLEIRLSPQGVPTQISVILKLLASTNENMSHDVVEELKGDNKLVIHLMCPFEDAKDHIEIADDAQHSEGRIVAQDPNDSVLNEELKGIAATLSVKSTAAVAFNKSTTIFIYPRGSPWRGLLRDTLRPDTDTVLYFRLVYPGPRPSLLSISEPMPPIATSHSHQDFAVLPLTSGTEGMISRLFEWHGKSLSKVAMLIFHNRHQNEMDEFSRYLREHNVKVYQSTTPGAWSYFCDAQDSVVHKIREGTVILHHSFSSIYQLEGLSELLCARNRRINFFTLPDQDLGGETLPELQAMFPSGQAVYIMDDCLHQSPHDLIPALEFLRNRLKTVPTPTHILGRPDLDKWLVRVAGSAPAESLATYNTVLKLFDSLGLWARSATYEDPTDPFLCGSTGIYFPKGSELPEYGALWDTDQTAAADHMAEWFAAWAYSMRGSCRRFALLSSVGSLKRMEWAARYPQLQVLRPDDWVKSEIERANGGRAR